MIDINKKYTYNGKPVRILCTDRNSPTQPVVVMTEDGNVEFYTSEGKWLLSDDSINDLVEAWEPKEEEMTSMTKEELYYRIGHDDYGKDMLNKLFSQNVVIPKGKNRHPYADVLHESVEGIIIEARLLNNISSEWREARLFSQDLEYRVKQSDHTYEWQCLYRPSSSKEYKVLMDNNGYFTEAEMMRWKAEYGDNWYIKPIEETKRVR